MALKKNMHQIIYNLQVFYWPSTSSIKLSQYFLLNYLNKIKLFLIGDKTSYFDKNLSFYVYKLII